MAITAATSSRTEVSTKGRAFPLGYFVLAFAFTWTSGGWPCSRRAD
jgi:hypothetical protein